MTSPGFAQLATSTAVLHPFLHGIRFKALRQWVSAGVHCLHLRILHPQLVNIASNFSRLEFPSGLQTLLEYSRKFQVRG